MVLAECFEGWDGGFDHSNILGSEDYVKNLQNIRRVEREVSRGLLDQSC